jgi:predicted nucleic-acid-binding Zn-ribbon protein
MNSLPAPTSDLRTCGTCIEKRYTANMRYIAAVSWPQCQYSEDQGDKPISQHTNSWIYKLEEGRKLSVTCEACGWQRLYNLYQVPEVDIKDRNFYDQKGKEIGIKDHKELLVILDEDADGKVKILGPLRGIRM